MSKPQTLESMFDRLEPVTESGCLIWTGCTYKGYGVVSFQGKQCLVHRLMWEIAVGPIPPDKHIDHLCRVRCCGNFHHMEPVSIKVNVLRGIGPTAINAARTICQRGHPLTPENTYVQPNKQRACRACKQERARQSHQMKMREKQAGGSLPSKRRLKTHCIHGHEFSVGNTYDYKGMRMCRQCRSNRGREVR